MKELRWVVWEDEICRQSEAVGEQAEVTVGASSFKDEVENKRISVEVWGRGETMLTLNDGMIGYVKCGNDNVCWMKMDEGEKCFFEWLMSTMSFVHKSYMWGGGEGEREPWTGHDDDTMFIQGRTELATSGGGMDGWMVNHNKTKNKKQWTCTVEIRNGAINAWIDMTYWLSDAWEDVMSVWYVKQESVWGVGHCPVAFAWGVCAELYKSDEGAIKNNKKF